MTLIAGCKIMDDGVDAGFTGNGSAQDGTAPTIWGDPQRSVLVGENYVYQPEAEDAARPETGDDEPERHAERGVRPRDHVDRAERLDRMAVIVVPVRVAVVARAVRPDQLVLVRRVSGHCLATTSGPHSRTP